ncbi:hypothetical protein ACROYT_G035101 [Oculina patagonica]
MKMVFMFVLFVVASEVWAQTVSPTCKKCFANQPCTTKKTGMVRSNTSNNFLEACSEKQWQPYYPQCSRCYDNRVSGLVGHWRMNEQSGNEVADDSGYENHGSASGTVPRLSKFSRGRYFDSSGKINVPDSSVLNFGLTSFSVAGWAKILDVTHPLTTFAVKKGHGCYFGPGRPGWLPGWETAHGYQAKGLRVCIRDKENRKVDATIEFDHGYQPVQLLGQWVHYAVVFDREQKKVFTFINGKKQSNTLDISTVKGSVDNNRALEFGHLYGWKTKGTLDEYRVYNKALDGFEVAAIFNNHLV